MSDPLSVIASVAGIAATGLKICKLLFDTYESYKNQNENVNCLLSKLERLPPCLQAVEKCVKDRGERLDEKDLCDSITAAAEGVTASLKELQHEVDKLVRDKTQDDKLKRLERLKLSMGSAAHRVTYPLRESTLKKLEEEVGYTMNDLSLILQLFQQIDTREAKDSLSNIHAMLEVIRADQISEKIRGWLKVPDVFVNYNLACKKRLAGTGDWFVNGDPFKHRLAGPGTALWAHGFAGCGKSILSSRIIEHTIAHCSSVPDSGVAFFYFSYDDANKQTASSMLRTFILQLTSQSKGGGDILSAFHKQYESTSPADNQLLECLHKLVDKLSNVFIVVDALDECPAPEQRRDLLDILVEMADTMPKQLHLLMTSRMERDIEQTMDIIVQESVPLRNESVDADIALYVSKQLESNRRLQKWRQHQGRIEEVFAEKAQSAFRWAQCQLVSLESCPSTEYHLEQQLKTLPKTLDETYARILKGIPPERADDARRILLMLCSAREPLTTTQLVEGLAMELNPTPVFNAKRKLGDPEDLLEFCPGLIETYEVSKYIRKARIAHFSVEEYLNSDRICNDAETAFFQIRPTAAEIVMTMFCVGILLSEPGTRSSCKDDVECRIHLAAYADRYWTKHYRMCENLPEINEQVLYLVQSNYRTHGISAYRLSTATREHRIIHRAIRYGAFPVVATLLLAVTMKSQLGWKYLLVSLDDQWDEIIPKSKRFELLRARELALHTMLEFPDPDGSNSQTCFIQATKWGLESLVQSLLQRVLTSKQRGPEGKNTGSARPTSLLPGLVHGLFNSICDTSMITLCQAFAGAAGTGNIAMLRLFLALDPNWQDSTTFIHRGYLKALSESVGWQLTETTYFLVNAGPPSDTISLLIIESFLEETLEEKNDDFCFMLFEENITRLKNQKVLSDCVELALTRERLDIVELFLGNGGKLTEQMLLSCPSSNFHDMLELLSTHANQGSMTLLDANQLFDMAMRKQHRSGVELALKLGATPEFNSPLSEARPLLRAYCYGWPEVVQLLLERGAPQTTRQEIMELSQHYPSRLWAKIQDPGVDLAPFFQLLVTLGQTTGDGSGGDNDQFWNLCFANIVKCRNVDLFQALVAHGVRPRFSPGTPALAQSLVNCDQKICQILILHGVTLDEPSSELYFKSKTPLEIATEMGDVSMIRQLVARGAKLPERQTFAELLAEAEENHLIMYRLKPLCA
ncbi:ankyrin repeat domain-containing protein 50 [Microdochium nivale]|nr:ankyrin repeat domain-containing protein 50 [Microdochium nivale]